MPRKQTVGEVLSSARRARCRFVVAKPIGQSAVIVYSYHRRLKSAVEAVGKLDKASVFQVCPSGLVAGL